MSPVDGEIRTESTNLTIGMSVEDRTLVDRAADLEGFTHRTKSTKPKRKPYGVGTWARVVLVQAAKAAIDAHEKPKKGNPG